MEQRQDVIVIGGGAAGLFAAAEAAIHGARTLVLEKNQRAGVKILASGGTRCNVTSTLERDALGALFGVRAARFLRHAFMSFGPMDLRLLLDAEGVITEEHPLEKVFPISGRAGDVLAALLARARRAGAAILTQAPVLDVESVPSGFKVTTRLRQFECSALVIAAGGRSYPKTGCTGDAYPWLEHLGHRLAPTRPALVPLRTRDAWPRMLAGIAVEDVVCLAKDAHGRTVFARQRPLLFTHRGLSGPGPMDCSRWINDPAAEDHRLHVDWMPDSTMQEIETFLTASGGARVVGVLDDLLPHRLVMTLMREAGVAADRRGSQLRRDERQRLAALLKGTPIEIVGDEGFDKAEVTAGGVVLDEVDPRTMASRKVKGLYIAGEVLDVDGPIGGFNFQAAFSTGRLAGIHAAAAARAADPKPTSGAD